MLCTNASIALILLLLYIFLSSVIMSPIEAGILYCETRCITGVEAIIRAISEMVQQFDDFICVFFFRRDVL